MPPACPNSRPISAMKDMLATIDGRHYLIRVNFQDLYLHRGPTQM
jgi:hypothetical protein